MPRLSVTPSYKPKWPLSMPYFTWSLYNYQYYSTVEILLIFFLSVSSAYALVFHSLWEFLFGFCIILSDLSLNIQFLLLIILCYEKAAINIFLNSFMRTCLYFGRINATKGLKWMIHYICIYVINYNKLSKWFRKLFNNFTIPPAMH